MVFQRLMGDTHITIPEQCSMRNEDVLFNCETKNAPVSGQLPSIKSLNYRWVNIHIFDAENNCGKNKITIKPSEGDKINGSSEEIVLGKNGQGAILIIFGKNDWKAIIFE
jgi:hypothetical protein